MSEEVSTAEDAEIEGAAIDARQADADQKGEPYVPTPFDGMAKDMGWKPLDQFKGDPSQWRSAEEFIRGSMTVIGTLRKKMDTLTRTSAAVTAKMLDDQRREIEARYDQAIDDGDKVAVRREAKRLADLENQVESISESPEKAFAAENPWYGKNRAATGLAVSISQSLADEGKTVDEQLEAAASEVRKRFPELFDEAPRRRTAPAVHRPESRSSVASTREPSVADLPKEARAAGEQYVQMVKDKMPGAKYSLADYAKTYWTERGARTA